MSYTVGFNPLFLFLYSLPFRRCHFILVMPLLFEELHTNTSSLKSFSSYLFRRDGEAFFLPLRVLELFLVF